jgi:hypothetical protein
MNNKQEKSAQCTKCTFYAQDNKAFCADCGKKLTEFDKLPQPINDIILQFYEEKYFKLSFKINKIKCYDSDTRSFLCEQFSSLEKIKKMRVQKFYNILGCLKETLKVSEIFETNNSIFLASFTNDIKSRINIFDFHEMESIQIFNNICENCSNYDRLNYSKYEINTKNINLENYIDQILKIISHFFLNLFGGVSFIIIFTIRNYTKCAHKY